MSVRRNEREVMEEFIEILRGEICLWNTKSRDYHDRDKREAAYQKLLHKLKEYEPKADKESVKRKINNLRSAYRKELRKVNISMRSGASTDEVYVPKLWYFHIFTFLNDMEIPRQSCSSMDDGSETNVGSSLFIL